MKPARKPTQAKRARSAKPAARAKSYRLESVTEAPRPTPPLGRRIRTALLRVLCFYTLG